MLFEFYAFRAISRANKERAEICLPLPCRLATHLGAPVALQQCRTLPVSLVILPDQERSPLVR